ncbi:PASTA domain-containing protein [Flindersiella endophytica]
MALTGITIGGAGTATPVAVPDVVGQDQADAEQALKDRGFKVLARQVEADGTEGTVFSQDPAGNTAANRGSTVQLFIVENPDIPLNIGQELAEIKAALALVETDTTAAQRNQAVLDKLDTVETDTTAAERNQAVLDKLDTVETDADAEARKQEILDQVALAETDVSAETRNQAVLDKLDTVETDYTAEQRKQEVVGKLETLESDDSAEARKQEILDALSEHDKDHPARKSSSTQRRS